MKNPSQSSSGLTFLPVILTASVLIFAGALAAFFPLPLVALCLGTWPVGLLILWLGRDVESPEERIAAVDAEHAKHLAHA